jgi:hypothetical protein
MDKPYKLCYYSFGPRVELIPNQHWFGVKIDIEEVASSILFSTQVFLFILFLTDVISDFYY